MAKSDRNSKTIKVLDSKPTRCCMSLIQKLIIPVPALIFIALILLFLSNSNIAEADQNLIRELQEKISDRSNQIGAIEKEIEQSKKQLEAVGREVNTLQNAVRSIELTQKKLEQDISLTENKIINASLSIEKLTLEISESEQRIEKNSQSLSETLRLLNETGESSSLVESLLKYGDFSSVWEEFETLQRFQVEVRQNLNNLKIIKDTLEKKREESESQKEQLELLNMDLKDQHGVSLINKKRQASLLSETKNQEAEYQKILQTNLARKAEFEKELFEFESQLRLVIDPSQTPPARPGILSWPLDSVFVTQYFGDTEFARSGAYRGRGHNGIDFRATMGTRVKSALSGIVSHIGNTDEIRGCYSFGKWVLVKHDNGLSTLYSHLSSIRVQPGQVVQTGEMVGLSGGLPGTFGAGYSTGPHLHFGLYITEGLRPQTYRSSTPCNGAFMPLADLKAYLDPMSYLPTLSQ